MSVLKEYFGEGEMAKRQGIIFCVNTKHTVEMEKLLNEAGISAKSYTGQTKNAEKVMLDFKEKKIRFLCACNMISEGWDYPELGILVMARPTLSKVLYLQQIGRGLRKTSVKKNMLTNPFEKFERKRFLYHSKDLGVISMNHALFAQMEKEDFQRAKKQMREDIRNYYRDMGV